MAVPEFGLDDRVAIVTGASRSIGRGIAQVLAESGADVVVAGRQRGDLERVAGEVEARGRRGVPVVCDVADPDAVSGLVAACKRELGPPDIAVANAGVFQEWGPAEELSREEWDRVVATDLTGVMLTCQEAGREMISNGGGSIVTISSLAGLVALAGAVSYTASKFGVIGLTKALAAEWARHGVRVNAIAPGFVERDVEPLKDDPEVLERIMGRTPLARWGKPREIGLATAFLVSPAAAFITGATLPVDGGWVAV
jgi:NAD(P)-dependent dehydrogenase (short-subunit alcohol dehydrogenase family)